MGIIHSNAARLSLTEAAVLADVPLKEVRRELDDKVLPAARKRGRVLVSQRAVLYLAVRSRFAFPLSKRDRKNLAHLLISHASSGKWSLRKNALVHSGPIPMELKHQALVEAVSHRLSVFARGRKRIRVDANILSGEPVFSGTRIAVRWVGERASKGEAVKDLLEDFPELDARDIEFAVLFARIGAGRGRPRKALHFVHKVS